MATGELILTQPGQLLSSNRRTIPVRHTRRIRSIIAGHLWTVVPSLISSARPLAGPPAQDFCTIVNDPIMGNIRLTGLFSDRAESDTLVLIVHGLSGDARSPYCAVAAQIAHNAGFASLRLSLRGSDMSGEDIVHGGLTDDLRGALADPKLARFRRVFLFGYSIGGHIALRAGIDQIDPRLWAIAAICPPLDLQAATIAFDDPSIRVYRRHIVDGLDKSYALVAARRRAPTPLAEVKRARSCRDRDAITIVPRFGFASASDYYQRASVSADLHRLQIPSLMIASRQDPIIPAQTLEPAIADASAALTVRWVDAGGHIFFPSSLDLGEPGRRGLESQVMNWLDRQ